jgi:beta-glucosidase/6-phospho-beta-glucosidase/beta-galactosidase
VARFMFCTGIENSYPTVPAANGANRRVDEMEKAKHYQCWKEDFSLIPELGISHLRYGVPYYTAHRGPDRYDWQFADETFAELQRLKITPIADLCHFGVPDWIGNFQNPDWPPLFAQYAKEFAIRFPWIHYYTPVNEIFIAAMFSGKYGWWNEALKTDRGFVTALHNLCKANVLAMRAILEVQPRAIFIQSESSEYFHPEKAKCADQADIYNEMRFLSLDLTYGYPLNVRMFEYLLDNGMTREDYHWFTKNQKKVHCVMGNDYYLTNEHLVELGGEIVSSGEIFGYYVITHQYFTRYGLPVMHTETNLCDAERAPAWLMKEWANVHRLKQDGVPMLGFTWYSLIDQVDWDTALREDNGTINPLGLYDMDRKIRPVGHAFKELIQDWHDVLPTQSLSLGLTR